MTDTQRKYAFTGRECEVNGRRVREIYATRSFGFVKKNDIGGWIETERNLNHAGSCWLGPGCYSMENATITDNALVIGDNVRLWDSAYICGNTLITGHNIFLNGNSIARDNSIINGVDSSISDFVQILGNSVLGGKNNHYGGYTALSGSPVISGQGQAFFNDAKLFGCCVVAGDALSFYHSFAAYHGAIIMGRNQIFRDRVALPKYSCTAPNGLGNFANISVQIQIPALITSPDEKHAAPVIAPLTDSIRPAISTPSLADDNALLSAN